MIGPTLTIALSVPLPTVPDGTPAWWFYTAVSLAVIILGIAKSGFGGGVGILAVPLMANAMPAAQAVGVMLPILLAADVFAVAQHHRHRSDHHLRWCLPGAVVGIAIGGVLLWWFQEGGTLTTALNLIVGGVCLLFVAVQCYRLMGGKFPAIPDTPGASTAVGGLAGGVSTLAHSAGPIMTIFLLEHRLEKRVLVGTLVVFFFLVNLGKLVPFIGLGLIDPHTLFDSAVFLPLVPIGSLLGIWMHKRIAQRPFAIIMYLGAAAAGARMVYLGLTAHGHG